MKSIILSVLCCTLVTTLVADSPVWKATQGPHTVYLGGTMHLLRKRDLPLPDVYDQAYAAADAVYFETDLAVLESEKFQRAMLHYLTYHDGKTLDDVLQPDTINALKKYLEFRGLPYESFKTFKVGLLNITLAMLEYGRIGVNEPGVDQRYHDRAIADGKKLGFLETPEEQLRFLLELGKGQEDELLLYTLDDMDELRKTTRVLIKAWREGDLALMNRELIGPMKTEFPDTYAMMLANRNAAWLPRIDEMIKSPEVELLLVGALHLGGADGLIAGLKAKGYTLSEVH
ncbi:TraB/GumN family protein [Synoicihabitans lomoniglobus]|uniref:TraB/GumN family protein n=1 Tax=Synoicihabitans lomoniglobus TaxID=2909285 RepID=A0AAF0I5Y1_9BACT|nr:TraB/GumN family protein [Opitutaceae bacterium LMO-M01]WED65776.1 TraB/GumN family protein [Opitutaceae bacterium LMO-M01]